MFGLGANHQPEDIKSAHDKQRRKHLGEGGVIFTAAEQAVLDKHVKLEEADAKHES